MIFQLLPYWLDWIYQLKKGLVVKMTSFFLSSVRLYILQCRWISLLFVRKCHQNDTLKYVLLTFGNQWHQTHFLLFLILIYVTQFVFNLDLRLIYYVIFIGKWNVKIIITHRGNVSRPWKQAFFLVQKNGNNIGVDTYENAYCFISWALCFFSLQAFQTLPNLILCV